MSLTENPSNTSSVTFESLNLNPLILKAVAEAGYVNPTPIQAKAIPAALAGRDLLASAQTGTGKTAAFILPALHRLATASAVPNCKGPRILVLTPTRELAMQVSDAARTYGTYFRNLSVVSILGGVPYDRQRQKMKRFVDIMVATPGRLIDYLQSGQLDFRRLEVLVLDEADRMLDMGFRDSIQEIAEALPKNRQTLLFSATLERSIIELANRFQNNPERIEITPPKARHEQIDQKVHYVTDLPAKNALLSHFLNQDEVKQAIIFTATKRGADKLAESLYRDGLQVEALHGDMRQNARLRTLQRLREGSTRLLVATDVAARGIDVKTITHIFNYDLPRSQEDYVHRIGRTGRAEMKGTAVSIAYPRERGQIRRIESYIGHNIASIVIPGFESKGGSEGSESPRRGGGGRGGRSFGGGNRNRRSGGGGGGGYGGGNSRRFRGPRRESSNRSQPQA